MNLKSNHRIFGMKFSNVYPLYIQKAERKKRTKEEVDQIIFWLTGYNQAELQQQINQENNFETFFPKHQLLIQIAHLLKVRCAVCVWKK